MIKILKLIYIKLYHVSLCILLGLGDICDGFSWDTADYIIDKVEEKRRALL